MWPHVYVICVCLVFLSVGDLLVHKHMDKIPELLKALAQNDCREHLEGLCG